MPKRLQDARQAAEIVAIQALSFIAGEPERLGLFLAETGIGPETLRHGPMKPMGLTDPRTGRRPWAVVQLRREDARAGSYNLVGFQNHMRFAEQIGELRRAGCAKQGHAIGLRRGCEQIGARD